jgi:hypothetical protein
MHIRYFAFCGILVLQFAPALSGWGSGHTIQAQAAIRGLPKDYPPFFLAALEQLKVTIGEPDRWRTKEQPSTDATTGPDHTFKWEIAPKPLPPDRYRYIIELARTGKFESPAATVRDYGTSAYAIVEWSEMLTAAFRRWRSAPDRQTPDRTAKLQLEQSILFIAGVLGHWVTDASNPMHVSIHVHGWSPLVPNPHGYKGEELHKRYESDYAGAVVQAKDVEALVTGEPRLLGDWLAETSRYIEANNRHVERIYQFDKIAPFGSGREPAEARPFTDARLADGARMLRDVWYSAWVKSGKPLPATSR